MSAAKLPWDVDIDATKAAMERVMRAFVVTRSHFTDAFSHAPVDKPTRSVSVLLRVWIPEGSEQRFMAIARVDVLRPPPRAQGGIDVSAWRPSTEPDRKPIARNP